MDADDTQPSDALVPVLTWPGRRPSLADLGTWHEALTNTVAGLVAADIVALWLYPSRGGAVLIGPSGLSAERMPPPPAEPLVSQEGLYALEDRLRAAGYSSVLAVPIRAEMQDVGLLLIGSLRNDAHTLADLRLLHRTAAQLATACRRLAAFSWVVPGPVADERSAIIANVTEGVLEAIGRAREGGDLVQLVSDALSNQVPHDRCELIAVAPAPVTRAIAGRDEQRPEKDHHTSGHRRVHRALLATISRRSRILRQHDADAVPKNGARCFGDQRPLPRVATHRIR